MNNLFKKSLNVIPALALTVIFTSLGRAETYTIDKSHSSIGFGITHLMVSTVRYPKFPPVGFRTVKGLFGTAFHLLVLVAGLTVPEYFFFPLGITYLAYGLFRFVILAFAEKSEPEPVPALTDDLPQENHQ